MFHHLPKRCVALIASALALLTVALPAAVSARAWPANDEASIFSRRYRGQDETGDSSGGGGGGGSGHGGGSSESGGGSSSGGSHGESGGSSGDSGGDHGGSSSGGEDKVEKPKTKSAGGDSDKDDRF